MHRRRDGFNITYLNTRQSGILSCTPGYCKNRNDPWPFDKNAGFNAYFGVGSDWISNNLTLGQAISVNGGGANALARHATAAALNVDGGGVAYPYTVAEVKAFVQAAYDGSASMEGNKNILEAGNELGCPLSTAGNREAAGRLQRPSAAPGYIRKGGRSWPPCRSAGSPLGLPWHGTGAIP
jgi:hypothetical protein